MPIIVGGTNYYIESLVWNFLLDDNKVSPVLTVSSSSYHILILFTIDFRCHKSFPL